MAIIRKIPWTIPPPIHSLLGIDRDNPLMKGVRGVFRPGPDGRMQEVAFNEPRTVETGDPLLGIDGRAARAGVGRDFGISSDQDADEFTGNSIVTTLDQSFMLLVLIKASSSTNQTMMSIQNSAATSEYFAFRQKGAGNGSLVLRTRASIGDVSDLTETGSPDRTGQLVTMGGVLLAPNDAEFYVNGRLVATNGNFAETTVGNHNSIAFGSLQDSTPTEYGDSIAYLGITWDRKLLAWEHKALHDNPWQIFQPRTQIIPIDVATGTTAALTGTAISGGVTEAEIVSGGETVIITLTNDTWAAAGTGPIGSTADTQALIDGFDSAQSEGTGWNAEVRDKEVTTSIVRTSDTVATWTITAAGAYDITADETITLTIPAVVLVTSGSDVTADATFDVTAAAAVGSTTIYLTLLGTG